MAWSKPAKTGSYYTNAFLFFSNTDSSLYMPPVKGTEYQIAFGGANLTNVLTTLLVVTNTGQFVALAGQTTKLTLTLTTTGASTGALSGSFTYPSLKSTHTISGAFISPSQGGFGYFLDTNSETGWFQIQVVGP